MKDIYKSMNSQDILRNLGISVDVVLDNSETYDYEIAGFNNDYDPKLLDFGNSITFDTPIKKDLSDDDSTIENIKLCEFDNTINDSNYIYSGLTVTFNYDDFTDHFNILDSEGNIIHDYENFILNNDLFTYTGITDETHYFFICEYPDSATPTPTATIEPTSTETPTPTSTETPTPTESSTPTPTPTDTPVPTSTETPTPTSTETPVPTGTETPTPTSTAEPTPTSTETPTPTDTPIPTSTETPTPTDTPIPTATNTPTPTSTETPTPTESSTPTPTSTETATPTPTPTGYTTTLNVSTVQKFTPSLSGLTLWYAEVTQSYVNNQNQYDATLNWIEVGTFNPIGDCSQGSGPSNTLSIILSGDHLSFIYTLIHFRDSNGTVIYGTRMSSLCNYNWQNEYHKKSASQILNTNPSYNLQFSIYSNTLSLVPPTPTDTPVPTSTETPTPTESSTPTPTPTDTPIPTATETPIPTSTETPTPTPTDTPIPTATETPIPTSTETPTPTPTDTPIPTSTETPTPTPTDTPVPTSTETPVPTATIEPTPTSTPIPTSTPVPSPTPTVNLWVPTPDAWFDASDTSSYTLSGSNLTSVTDKAGNFNINVDGTPTRVSNGLNNKNVWDFNGSESLISTNSGPYASGGNHWAIGVFQFHTTTSTKDSFWSADGGRTYAISSSNSSNNWYGEIDYDGSNSIVNGKARNTFTQGINQSTWAIVAVIANKTDNEFYGRLNGSIKTNVDVYNNSMNTNCTDLRMMRNRSGVKLDGRMAEYFHFASYVGGDTNNYSEVWKAEGYLAHKWGLTSLLPSNHPYKNNPPTT